MLNSCWTRIENLSEICVYLRDKLWITVSKATIIEVSEKQILIMLAQSEKTLLHLLLYVLNHVGNMCCTELCKKY